MSQVKKILTAMYNICSSIANLNLIEDDGIVSAVNSSN